MQKSLGERESEQVLANPRYFTYLSSSTRYVTEEALLNIPAPPDTTCRSKEPGPQLEPRPWVHDPSGAFSTISCHFSALDETSVIKMQR